MHIDVYIYICTYVYMYVCIYTYIYIYIYAMMILASGGEAEVGGGRRGRGGAKATR